DTNPKSAYWRSRGVIGIGNSTGPLRLVTGRRRVDGDERCGDLQWFWRRLAWSRLEWQPPPRAPMTAGGDIRSGGKKVGASTRGASANSAGTGGASTIGTRNPEITATPPTPPPRPSPPGARER